MSKYFIVAIGRSGTLWLSDLLHQANGHTCLHESGDTRSKAIPQPWTPFPMERWLYEDSYGEVNGMLRYHLSGQYLGPEMEFESSHRVYLRRDPMRIIASWMQQSNRDITELSATCHEVLWHAANLDAWARLSGSRIIDVENLWRSREVTQTFVDSLGLDLIVTDEMMQIKNARPAHIPVRFQWDHAGLAIAEKSAQRVGYPYSLTPP
jgi:hypothetical protein